MWDEETVAHPNELRRRQPWPAAGTLSSRRHHARTEGDVVYWLVYSPDYSPLACLLFLPLCSRDARLFGLLTRYGSCSRPCWDSLSARRCPGRRSVRPPTGTIGRWDVRWCGRGWVRRCFPPTVAASRQASLPRS